MEPRQKLDKNKQQGKILTYADKLKLMRDRIRTEMVAHGIQTDQDSFIAEAFDSWRADIIAEELQEELRGEIGADSRTPANDESAESEEPVEAICPTKAVTSIDPKSKRTPTD